MTSATRSIPLHRRDGSVRAWAIVDTEDFARVGGRRWSLNGKGYVGHANELLHRVVMGLTKGDGYLVDHINGDKLDNRRGNLRLATKSQNHANRHHLSRLNTTGFHGVQFVPGRDKPWKVLIGKHGRSYYLGMFPTPATALMARRDAELRLFGHVSPLTRAALQRIEVPTASADTGAARAPGSPRAGKEPRA